MLSFARPRGPINSRFISNASPLSPPSPLLSSHSFAIPYSNVIVPPLPSPPIQPAQTSYKVGLFIGRIEQPGQTIPRGIVSLVLQIKEFPYPYPPIPDCMIGPVSYLTTGSHGAHASLGPLYFYPILLDVVNGFGSFSSFLNG